MKIKTLNAISMNVRNEERALNFYKFLIFTSEAHKIEFLKDQDNIDNSINVKEFVGNSFLLADTFLQTIYRRHNIIYQLRYLYFVSNEKYLDLLETYFYNFDPPRRNSFQGRNEILGLRISKDILIKYKQWC